MNATERSQVGLTMAETNPPVLVGRAVEVSDRFPSQTRGPVVITYGHDSRQHLLVQPRVLSVAGVGVHRGACRRASRLSAPEGLRLLETDPFFKINALSPALYRELALSGIDASH